MTVSVKGERKACGYGSRSGGVELDVSGGRLSTTANELVLVSVVVELVSVAMVLVSIAMEMVLMCSPGTIAMPSVL